MLRILTAGESHGKMEVAVLEGFPAGLKVDINIINKELAKRQKGYGRGKRMNIEKDKVDIVAGLKDSKTIGSPIAILIKNKDFSINKLPPVKSVRPGHADFSGITKYGFNDARLVLERASARETVTRVAVGSICKMFLSSFNIYILSHTISIGNIRISRDKVSIEDIKKINNSNLRCLDKTKEKQMIKLIDEARKRKDTLGGIIEIIIEGVPPGLGSYVQFDRKLDAKLAGSIVSIPGIKAVEIGEGISNSQKFGSEVHDEIYKNKKDSIIRNTNRAGGLEGGVSNGEQILIRAYMKPISTLMNPLNTINIDTLKKDKASRERSDICAVASCGIIAESMCAIDITNQFLQKFGSDNIRDISKSFENYLDRIKKYYKR